MNTLSASLSRLPISRFIVVIFALTVTGILRATAQEAWPQKTTDALLRDFVDNCVWIRPGTDEFPPQFQMGGQFVSPFALPERPVAMSQSFRISKFEMTQDLYSAIMGRNPSRWTGPRNSVESMTFLDAEVFCTKLTMQLRTEKLISTDHVVRLPTEAEWEYCCRAGTDTLYSFGDSASSASASDGATSILNEYAWHTGNAAGNDPAVGVLKANPWGLFDMHGYLWEYVSAEYSTGDPVATNSSVATRPTTGATVRLIRGGSWRDRASWLTSGTRQPIPDHVGSDAIGFRCVIANKPKP